MSCEGNSIKEKFTDEELERLWKELGDVYLYLDKNGSARLNESWFIFEKGTSYDDIIWHWFDDRYTGGIHTLIKVFELKERGRLCAEAEKQNNDAWLKRKQQALAKVEPLHEKGIYLDDFIETWTHSIKWERGLPAIRGERGMDFIMNSTLEEIENAFNKSRKE